MAAHYRTLGLSQDASFDDVKKAYKELARKWHPDKNPKNKSLAEKKFKEISEAYRVLSNVEDRLKYDQDEEMKQFQQEMTKKRRRDEKIRRMAREQEEYVSKQEARRARAHNPPPDHLFAFRTNESLFNDFFAERDSWRRRVPNMFTHEQHIGHVMRDMSEMMRAAFDTRNSQTGGRRHHHQRRAYTLSQPDNMDDVFNAFFSNKGGFNTAGFSY